MTDTAIVLAQAKYRSTDAKIAHGLVRGSNRFQVLAIVDPDAAGEDAGILLDGDYRDIPIVASISEALERCNTLPQYCVVGVATHAGRFTADLRSQLLEATNAGLSIVNGLHDCASDDPQIVAAAARKGTTILDLRKPKPGRELHFWSGAIAQVRTPRIAVLGMDCAIGKRTTARLLVEALTAAGIHAEMIYTGQTGWMQGGHYGFVLDSVINDYVSGELEHAIVTCDHEAKPDVMIIEGQSSLRNPSGPCGAELLSSAGARGVVMQHAPAREFFEGHAQLGLRIPSIEEEIALVTLYGGRTLAVTINEEHMDDEAVRECQQTLGQRLAVPVIRPLRGETDSLVSIVRRFVTEQTK